MAESTTGMSAAASGAAGPLTLTRVFDAPRARVWTAWTDPRHVARWWGPHGFTIPVCELDLRTGGALRIVMRGPDGIEYPLRGVFQDIVAPERLVFTTCALADASGTPQLEALHTLTLAEDGGKTTLTLHVVVTTATPGAQQALAGMEEGWTQSLVRLAADLATA